MPPPVSAAGLPAMPGYPQPPFYPAYNSFMGVEPASMYAAGAPPPPTPPIQTDAQP
jgi:hypothetical protein